jgi:hypothetical protein
MPATTTAIPGANAAYISAVAIQPDGKLIGAGTAAGKNGLILTAARYLAR